MQMRTGKLIASAHILGLAIRNNTQALVAADKGTDIYLNIRQVPILCGPAIPMINDQMAAGSCGNRSCGGGCHPKIRCVFADHHIVMGSKIYRASHLVIMRAGWQPPDTVIKSIKSHPGKPLLPGPLKHVHWRRRR